MEATSFNRMLDRETQGATKQFDRQKRSKDRCIFWRCTLSHVWLPLNLHCPFTQGKMLFSCFTLASIHTNPHKGGTTTIL